MQDTTTQPGGTSVLAVLRSLLPQRPLRLTEALAIAERQADQLLRLRGVTAIPVPVSVVTALPRITAHLDPALPRQAASGASDWDQQRRTWVISVNPDEPRTRQRFTVLHEYKHIIDHGHPGLTGPLPRSVYGLDPVEYLAEYFAGCVLMPKRLVKRAFYDGIQEPHDLAQLFDVSVRAMHVRLQQLELTDPADDHHAATHRRTAQQRRSTGRYHRPLAWATTSIHRTLEVA